MDHSFDTTFAMTTLPTTNVTDVDTMVTSVSQEKLKQMDEALEKL